MQREGAGVDFLIEVILEVYLELMTAFVPEKNLSKKHKIIAKVLAVLVAFVLLGLAVWGIYLLVERANTLGIIPIAVALVLSLAQIILGIVLYKKYH